MIANNLEVYKTLEGDYKLTLTLQSKPDENHLNNLLQHVNNGKKLDVQIKKYRKKRSLDANAYFWQLISKIAVELNNDKWDIYLAMLKRYGKYTYIAVKPNVVDAVKAQWRETEEVGEIEINGKKAIQLLCYFGSSTYNSKEMSTLIEGTVYEAKELGIETLPPIELESLLLQI